MGCAVVPSRERERERKREEGVSFLSPVRLTGVEQLRVAR